MAGHFQTNYPKINWVNRDHHQIKSHLIFNFPYRVKVREMPSHAQPIFRSASYGATGVVLLDLGLNYCPDRRLWRFVGVWTTFGGILWAMGPAKIGRSTADVRAIRSAIAILGAYGAYPPFRNGQTWGQIERAFYEYHHRQDQLAIAVTNTKGATACLLKLRCIRKNYPGILHGLLSTS
jgi:hypothetical protein